MEIIKSLENSSFDDIFEAFKEAFKDYEVQVNRTELETMLNRRGFNPNLSFAAFDNDKIVSFTLNGIGNFNDIKTAYDTGSGTIEAYRSKGLATRIFNHSIPHLKQAGVKQYLLEVLQHNEKAVSIYKKVGFETTREFNYFVKLNESLNLNEYKIDSSYNIDIISKYDDKILNKFCDFTPSWQNSFESIMRKIEDFKIIIASHDNHIVGYCITDPKTGDITQIAVNKEYRRKGIGSTLFSKAIELNKFGSVKIVNTDIDCNSINGFLKYHGIEPNGKQFEMIYEL
jgi:ribosomal protein S18 acetylase RimI-like enzyme